MKKYLYFLATALFVMQLSAQTTWTVIPEGGGDYTTITQALTDDDLEDGDIIIVYEGIYYENVTINNDITLKGRGENYTSTTIIDGSQNPTGSIITVNVGLSDVIIEGLTIQSNTTASGKGVLIYNSDVLLTGCVITGIRMGVYLDGWDQPYQMPIIDNNEISSNNWGIFCDTAIFPYIVNNEIYNNTVSGIKLSGVNPPPDETDVKITNNIIYGHDNQQASSAIITDAVNLNLSTNVIHDNNYAFKIGYVPPNFIKLINNTVCENEYFLSNSLLAYITNCIIWDNTNFLPTPSGPIPYSINYSCIQQTNVQYNGGTGVIIQDPLFRDATIDDFTLQWSSIQKSPCIDTGDPTSGEDPDGSIVDMGAYYKEHVIKEYELVAPGAQEEWNWLCFDILDIYDPTVTNQIQNLLDPIKLDLNLGKQENLEFSYNPPNWQNGEEVIYSPLGFKILMEEASSFEVSGFRYPYNTSFTVYANSTIGDWIGYFVGKTQHVYDAFDGYLGNIYEIKHKDWSIRSESGVGGWPDVPYTLSPGDMVVVKCAEDITYFCWINQAETEKHTEPEAQYFSYSEESDYIPIYVELDETNLPDEVGVIVEGECKGAKVVDDEFIDICAYITETQTGIVELELSYGSRGVNTKYDEYILIEPDTGNRELSVIDLSNKQDHYYVSFKSFDDETSSIPERLTASNYPNPFNPYTTISYSLPVDGKIEISIYNMKGQLVKELVSGSQTVGHYEVVWNGNDIAGKKVSSGIYYYQIKACDKIISKKILMLK